jgi:BMFP domain-containing protein YqiC
MSKSRFVFDKFAELIEQGLVSYKDISVEIVNILKSKRDEIVFRMKLASKEEVEILNKRINNLEKKLNKINKSKTSKKTKRAKKS